MARVLIVQKTYLEIFGVLSVASALREEGHDVRISLDRGARLMREVTEFRPLAVGFSAVSTNVHDNLVDAESLKRNFPDVSIVFGGVHATFFPELIENPFVDAVCRGEGEGAFAEYVGALADRRSTAGILNLWVKHGGAIHRNPLRPLINDLDSLPFPDRSLYYSRYPFLRDNPVKNFLASRGCPFSCSFCFNRPWRRLYRESGCALRPRARSAENVIAEIDSLRGRYPMERIAFQDENFCLDKAWLLRFLDLYASSVSLPFFCMLHVSAVDEEIVAALKSANCYRTTFGLETGYERLRREVLKKDVSDDRIRFVASLLHSYGIPFHTTNIFCFPEETYDSAVKTVRLNADIAPHSTVAFRFMPFPNLELTDLAIQKGWLDQNEVTNWKNLHRMVVDIPDRKSISRLRLMFPLAVRRPKLIPLVACLCRLPVGPLALIVFYASEIFSFSSRNRHKLSYVVSNFFQLKKLYRSYTRD